MSDKWIVLRRSNGLVERVCEHNVGHPSKALTPPYFYYGEHGCDGCCSLPEFAEAERKDSAASGEGEG